jgi:hypothetical protein
MEFRSHVSVVLRVNCRPHEVVVDARTTLRSNEMMAGDLAGAMPLRDIANACEPRSKAPTYHALQPRPRARRLDARESRNIVATHGLIALPGAVLSPCEQSTSFGSASARRIP